LADIIPECWLEIMECESIQISRLLRDFGPLACILFHRVGTLCKQNDNLHDMRLLRFIICSEADDQRSEDERATFYDLKFIVLLLDYFNYYVSLAKRDLESKKKALQIFSIFPTFKELRKALDHGPLRSEVTYSLYFTLL
jgi:hypothetical protein